MFPIALQKLSDWVLAEADKDVRGMGPDDREAVRNSFRNKVMDNKALYNGLTVPEIYQHFQEFIASKSADHFVGSSRIEDTSCKSLMEAYQRPELIEQGDGESDPTAKLEP